jgi:hypothetical protein
MSALTYSVDVRRSMGGAVQLTLLLLSCAEHQALAFSSYALRLPCGAPSATASNSHTQLRLVRARSQGNTLPGSSTFYVAKADGAEKLISLRAGSMEPTPKGFVARIKGKALKAGGVMLLAFIAYHVALGAFKTVVFWICSGMLAWSAFFTWNFFKGRKRLGKYVKE